MPHLRMVRAKKLPRNVTARPCPTRFVVTGPPAAGKTTWTTAHRGPGVYVWDTDAVARVVCGPDYAGEREAIPLLCEMRDALLAKLATTWAPCIVIIGHYPRALAVADRLAAELVVIDTAADLCIERLRHRGGDQTRQIQAVAAWWDEYETTR